MLERYIELQVYQAVVENIACEQAAKMIAMKNATDNAGELIKEFQLAYNKARQAAITQELAEIVGGADAYIRGYMMNVGTGTVIVEIIGAVVMLNFHAIRFLKFMML